VLGGLAALALVAAAIGWALLTVVRSLQHRLRGAWKLGLAALTDGAAGGGATGRPVLVAVRAAAARRHRPGLLAQWQKRLPADTPNYFLMNIQPDQTDAARGAGTAGVADADLEPFSTGRLLAIDGKPPARTDRDPQDGDAVNRPVNYSWRHVFPPANTLVAGRFWAEDSTAAEASVEEAWAKRYG
jgi:putative ABC transport system permease protein